jgi:hypothetical protein
MDLVVGCGAKKKHQSEKPNSGENANQNRAQGICEEVNAKCK